jgi:hypothetical protein
MVGPAARGTRARGGASPPEEGQTKDLKDPSGGLKDP